MSKAFNAGSSAFIQQVQLHTSDSLMLNYDRYEILDSKKIRSAVGVGSFTLSLRRIAREFGFVKQQLC
jgi:hypothetical protein